MKHKEWIQLILTLDEGYHELITASLVELGFEGFLSEDRILTCSIPSEKWNESTQEKTPDVLKMFSGSLGITPIPFKTEIVKQQNWNLAWERSIKSISAGKRIIIVPSWRKPPKPKKGKIILRIDPKMSFGTGHHETTRLCIEMLEKHLKKGMSVLDFGAGTAVLAIVAAKFGAMSVLAVDNDEWTFENAMENIRRNNVSQKVKVVIGSVEKLPKRKFDLIVANIDMPTIRKTIGGLVSHMKKKGLVIFSGLLKIDEDEMLRFGDSLELVRIETIIENDWIAISFKRK
jgi:ribosomal protein L11 methyltransferase